MDKSVIDEVIIRNGDYKDIFEICNIEKSLFGKNCWSLTNIQNELKLNFSKTMVAEYKGNIIAYIIGWIIEDEIHIMRIGVKDIFQNKGIGTKLLINYIESFKNKTKIILEVASKNKKAINFYKKHRFEILSIRKDYYQNDDAIIMQLMMNNEN